jgi:hypothetical protein
MFAAGGRSSLVVRLKSSRIWTNSVLKVGGTPQVGLINFPQHLPSKFLLCVDLKSDVVHFFLACMSPPHDLHVLPFNYSGTQIGHLLSAARLASIDCYYCLPIVTSAARLAMLLLHSLTCHPDVRTRVIVT